MDCGPAALTSLLKGYGIHANYERLREACHTDVDGTSIDTVEEIATALGVQCEQTLVPAHHLLFDSAQALPALLVMVAPNQVLHLVVAWRRHGRWLQIMDPAHGRRFIHERQLLSEVYYHVTPLARETWEEWAMADDFCGPLRERCQRLHVSPSLVDSAREGGGDGLAVLDAALRMTQALVDDRCVHLGRESQRTIEHAIAARDAIPQCYWTVLGTDNPEAETVMTAQAIVVRSAGVEATAPEDVPSPELRAVLATPPRNPAQEVRQQLVTQKRLLMTLTVLVALVACSRVAEALVFRSLIGLFTELATANQKLIILGSIATFLASLLLFEFGLDKGLRRVGRILEIRLRISFFEKLRSMPAAYFMTRPASDMASRAHLAEQVRDLPMLIAQLMLALLQTIAIIVALFVIDATVGLVALLATTTLAVILYLASRPLIERDLRFRTHLGGLTSFYLDALTGIDVIRTHGAERSVRNEHQRQLVAWAGAGLDLYRANAWVRALAVTLGFVAATLIVWSFTAQPGILLVAYWALFLPIAADQVALLLRALVGQWSIAQRVLEPLAYPTDELIAEEKGEQLDEAALELQWKNAQVTVAGQHVLQDLNLHIAPGEHTAVVGMSGAGKSTLLSTLLGWTRVSEGTIEINGRACSASEIRGYRSAIAWIDPAVTLWNRSLLDNITYGSKGHTPDQLSHVMRDAELHELPALLPEAMQTEIGENGRLLSGGQGQRTRIARALNQDGTRLVLLDEPFRGLDGAQRARLLDRLRAHWKGTTLLCATHDLELAQRFSRVLVIEQGQIVEDGSPTQLLSHPSRFGELVSAANVARQRLHDATQWRRITIAGQLTESKL